jgi:hypothetical protein
LTSRTHHDQNLMRGAMVSKWDICQTDDDLDIKALNDNDAIEN